MPWFEDIKIGTSSDLGSYTFTQEEIIAFGKKFDPQPFHVDPEAAAQTHFGGIIASGWHTCSIWMKLMIASRIGDTVEEEPDEDGRTPPRGGPSPGVLDIRWKQPVRPSDTISYHTEVVEKIDLKSRPNIGIIRSLNTGTNQNGKTVITFLGQGLIERKTPFVSAK